MTIENILNRISLIFKDLFDDNNLIITESTNSNDIEGWDSLMHINLVFAIEKEFGVKFSIDEVTEFKNVGEVINVIKERAVI